MVESIQQLLAGFGIAATLTNLLYCLLGAVAGTMVGILPGLGPIAGIALLIPVTFGLNPTSAIIMLCGIYYGAMYGGSTTSILLNVPGETASVIIIGPGTTPWIMSAPRRMAVGGAKGIPRTNRGMNADWQAALFAASGPATPSITPVPKSSGCLEILFSII
ncbi:MAG: tripartite tricarboxylate transporter permease [Proteobacteria bacterium]|nr:tripartite tricarboxylate transporter permease [Pseudomonadota bacterium]